LPRWPVRVPRGLKGFVYLASLLFALLSSLAVYTLAPGRVIRVADGDTLTLFSRERDMEKIRLYGVDAPESGQPWGAEAGSFVSALVMLQEVEIEVRDRDRYNRLVAELRLPDGRSLNEELLRNGHAWVYRDYCPDLRCLAWLALEGEARLNRRGLWADENPVAPWVWRSRRK
jgi:endonuclease YncB( thermonuclease family)